MDPITTAMALAQFVPQIIKWVTGSDKAAEAAGKVVEIAETVTGRSGIESVEALRADPSLVLQFRTAVLQMEADLDRAFLADRADARKRDTAFVEAGRYNFRADLLAVLAVGALVLCVWLVASDPLLPGGAREAIMFVAGVFAAAVRDVYGFEFGSSRGSKEKDEIVAKLRL